MTTLEHPSTSAFHYWRLSRDGDPAGLRLYERHYSARRYRDDRPRRLFVGPGEKLVLIAPGGDAVLAWRRFYSRNGQEGVNCAVFRNESRRRSSLLLREGMGIAWRRWPRQRLYTYVNPGKIRSANPGCCFKAAGWRTCGRTNGGLVILEALPLADSNIYPRQFHFPEFGRVELFSRRIQCAASS